VNWQPDDNERVALANEPGRERRAAAFPGGAWLERRRGTDAVVPQASLTLRKNACALDTLDIGPQGQTDAGKLESPSSRGLQFCSSPNQSDAPEGPRTDRGYTTDPTPLLGPSSVHLP